MKQKRIVVSLIALFVVLNAAMVVAAPVMAQMPEEESPMVIRYEANGILSAVEMDVGDILEFKLRSGEVRTLVLNSTNAEIVYTNLDPLKVGKASGATVYHFTCDIIIDGVPMTLQRYVCSQESFYEPYVINGMRIWFDAVTDIFDLVNENHGECKPNKQARFAIADATERICPDELKPWFPLPPETLDIRDCYMGNNCWLGPYLGANAHGGLDLNHPKGTAIWAPIDFDDHYLFNSLAQGHNNNRWRGTHTWPNGDTWILQIHHIYHLLVPEHTPIKAGTLYAEAAGASVGNHEHSHFVFRVKENGADEELLLDPWILFWQMYEDLKERMGAIKAVMEPLSPAQTGEIVSFSSLGSRTGPIGHELSYRWLFGDGGWSDEANPTHVYVKPGVYPVTLVVSDGAQTDSFTQHITIIGANTEEPALILESDEPTFRRRPVHAMDVYGQPLRWLPHTLYFTARATRPIPNPKTVILRNEGAATLSQAVIIDVDYNHGDGWLKLELAGSGNNQQLYVTCDASGLAAGKYSARVQIACPGAVNEVQGFDIELLVASQEAGNEWLNMTPIQVVDDRDPGFYATPWFWIGCEVQTTAVPKGYGGFHLTNGGRAAEDEFVRFTPDLPSGKHRVSLVRETPFTRDTGFWVLVRHRDGEDKIWMEPSKTRVIGTFYFDEGTDGYVEIHTKDSRGEVLADAVMFHLLEQD